MNANKPSLLWRVKTNEPEHFGDFISDQQIAMLDEQLARAEQDKE